MQSHCIHNRYQIKEIIGRGRVSVVHRAFDKRIKRYVAIKQISSSTPNYEKTVKKLRREYHLLSDIHHFNIIKAYDFFQEEGSSFFVMEYARGVPLDTFIVNHPWSLDLVEQLAISIQICQAIEQVHNRGLLHRDIKPQNIFIDTEEGTVKLLDLGISKSLHSNLHTLTKTLAIQGKVGYMSPERINGTECSNSDVFSLGVVLYQLFSWSRRSPFTGNNVFSTIDRVQKYSPPPIVNYLYSPDQEHYQQLSLILNNTLHKDPQQRTQKVQKLCKELSNLYKTFPHIGSKWFVDVTYINKKKTTQTINFLRNSRFIKYAIAIVFALIIVFVSIGIKNAQQNSALRSSSVKIENSLSQQESAENFFQKALDSYYFKNNYVQSWEENKRALALYSKEPRYLVHKAKMLFLGHGVEKNVSQAHQIAQSQLFKLKANKDGFSLYILGYAYSIGLGIPKNYRESVNWYTKGVQKNHPVAMNNLAIYYDNQKKLVDAFLLLQKSAQMGLPTAQVNIALRYFRGFGVVRDYGKAVSLFHQAASSNHSQAMEQLGICYYNGYGVNKNYIQAVEWFRKAALTNRVLAIYGLGYCYEHGHGVKRSIVEAIIWYKKAAVFDYEPAKKRLEIINR
ncbi:protein kinase [Candidatus Uabimicrobium sp. HlEnr_7]|uniref:protein kinase domain-containing protein n=1 Tax=Candidatus Uabimicrobium helgolandensis TaxID=3095367 RepID=UPI0035565EF9